MVTCEEVVGGLSDYLADEIWPATRLEFERHLVECRSCDAYARSFQQALELAKGAWDDPEISEDAVQGILDRVFSRPTCLTAEEARALVDASSGVLRSVLRAALHTAIHPAELLTLRWVDVNLSLRQVTARGTRGCAARQVPLNAETLGLLDALHAERPDSASPDGFVFTREDGSRLDRATLSDLLARAVASCGDAIAPRKRERVTLATMRHTAASILVSEGIRVADVARLLGISVRWAERRYGHFGHAPLRRAVDALGGVLSPRQAENRSRAWAFGGRRPG